MRDLNIAVLAGDDRELEVLAFGLPCRAGAQLAIDVTFRSPVTSAGFRIREQRQRMQLWRTWRGLIRKPHTRSL